MVSSRFRHGTDLPAARYGLLCAKGRNGGPEGECWHHALIVWTTWAILSLRFLEGRSGFTELYSPSSYGPRFHFCTGFFGRNQTGTTEVVSSNILPWSSNITCSQLLIEDIFSKPPGSESSTALLAGKVIRRLWRQVL